ncbi:MAG: hypothetical protein MJZ17_07305 [Bacteroidales bacterium]|nr:hypothetical protein [Bacteroidales bacterium]
MASKEPVKDIFRRMMIRHSISKTPTGILPLGSIHSVTVLLDWGESDTADTEAAVRDFFGKRRCGLFIINPGPKDFTCFGRLRKRVRLSDGKSPRSEDLFISLATCSTFAEQHEAAASPARFKIGRSQTLAESYDFVMSDAPTKHNTQLEAFEAIVEHLQKIK